MTNNIPGLKFFPRIPQTSLQLLIRADSGCACGAGDVVEKLLLVAVVLELLFDQKLKVDDDEPVGIIGVRILGAS